MLMASILFKMIEGAVEEFSEMIEVIRIEDTFFRYACLFCQSSYLCGMFFIFRAEYENRLALSGIICFLQAAENYGISLQFVLQSL